ncbi:MAG TPA: hypothetical protein VH482_06515 [Thermomicrobiales bacterium]|jgi:hypothetical protein
MNAGLLNWLAWLAYANGRAREAERRGVAECDLPHDPVAPRKRAVLAAGAGVAFLAVLMLVAAVAAAVSLVA